jgi:hypothetical protein
MFIDVKKITIRKWWIALYWKSWILYTRLITHCPIRFNKEKGPHPLFLSLKLEKFIFLKTLVGENTLCNMRKIMIVDLDVDNKQITTKT